MIHAVNERVKAKVNSNSNFRAIPDLTSRSQPLSTGVYLDILVLMVAVHHCIHTKTRHFSSRVAICVQSNECGVLFLARICQILIANVDL